MVPLRRGPVCLNKEHLVDFVITLKVCDQNGVVRMTKFAIFAVLSLTAVNDLMS